MPAIANKIIRFLNSENRYELDDLGVDDRTKTILEVKKVPTKKNLVVQLTEKCHTLEVAVNRFFKEGLPSLFVINDKLMTREDYLKKLQDTTKSSNIKGSMTGRAFYEAISNICFMQNKIKHIFIVKPTFAKYTEVDEIYHRVTKISIPDEERWEKCEYQD